MLQLDKVQEELNRAKAVFEEKVAEQSRHMAWVIAVIYSQVSLLNPLVILAKNEL